MGNLLLKSIGRTGTGILSFTMLVIMLSAAAGTAHAQDKMRVTGTVTDSSGSTLSGVAVTVQNTTIGTTTNNDGLYVIDVNSNQVLRFSLPGYITQDVAVNGRSEINVVIQDDTQKFEEIVVVGYGKQKRAAMVSAVTSVSAKELSMPTSNLTANLSGQLAGLISVQRVAEPGRDEAEFYIRGMASYAGAAATKPLILVDGVPRKIGDLEADEIESFSILKDASATAVYGAEGANGVVLVTTKRGLISKPKISFRAEYSLASPQRVPEFVDSWQYLELANEALLHDREAPYNPFSNFTLEETIEKYRSGEDRDLYPNTKWTEELISNIVQSQRYTLGFRGGAENAKYFVSLGFYDQGGVFKKNPFSVYDSDFGFQRYNLRANVDLKVSKTTNMTVDLSGQLTNKLSTIRSTDEIYEFMLYTPPHLFPAVYSDGTLASFAVYGDGNNRNPFNLLYNEGYLKEWNARLQTNVTLTQDLKFITQGLNLNGKVSFDYDGSMMTRRRYNPFNYNAKQRDENGDLIYVASTGPGTEGFTSQTFDPEIVGDLPYNRKIYIEGSLNYGRTFGRHDVSAMILYTQKEEQTRSPILPTRKQGIVGRATYSFGNRYFLEANFGYTGSHQFAKGHRWGFFPAVGVSYFLSNEQFYPEAVRKVMSTFKIRLSYGRTGNDKIDGSSNNFLWRSTYTLNSGFHWYQGFKDNAPSKGIGDGVRDSRPSNYDLGWEIEVKRNIGLDLGFWNNNIEISADYFNNRRSGILDERVTISNLVGLHANPFMNNGIVDNWGVDASLNARHKFGDWLVSARGTFTFARNKIIERDETPYVYEYQSIIGYRVNERLIYIAERLYTEDDFIKTPYPNGYKYTLKPGLPSVTLNGNDYIGPGDIKYLDYNNDGVIDTHDRVRGIGYTHYPEINYGFGFNVDWKGIYVSVFFQGVANTSIMMSQSGSQGAVDYQTYNVVSPFSWGVEKSNFRTMFLDRWTQDNPSQDVLMPRIHTRYDRNINKEANTWWLKNGNFLRLKNLEIGYSLPKRITDKMGMDNFRVYMLGNNLYLWDHLKIWDPEQGQNNGGMKWPMSRTFTFGVDFNL